jgi:hypothetical protein
MKFIYSVLFFVCVFGVVQAQRLTELKNSKPIICYASGKDAPDVVAPPTEFMQWRKSKSSRLQSSQIVVEYVNFPSDNKAKNAFQFAVDIWKTQINSPVTIHMKAQWSTLASGVLGQAIWGTAFANFDGAQHLNTFYPVALAEKIAGKDLNPTTDPDIVATFNSTTTWYYGTDGQAPSGTMDLVTIVLHEIAHGLGFTDTYDVENNSGSVGLQNGSVAVPFVYDLLVENSAKQKLFSEFTSPSVDLKTQLTSGNVFFDSPLAISSVGGSKIKLYAPATWNDGSSIAHLDEATYITPGDANKLMTPQIAFAEVIHDPGSILLNVFKEIGWVSTRIEHDALKDTERKDGAPYIVKAKIVSDNGYNASQVILKYTIDNINFTSVTMTSTGMANEFQASIPGRTTDGSYGYFISIIDALNRTFTNPGKIETQKKSTEQGLVVFQVGPDTKGPEIIHTPVSYIKEGETNINLTAQITDNIGVQSVRVDYNIKGGSTQSIPMSLTGENSYAATIVVPSSLTIGDKIEYKIIATDQSSNSNITQSPVTGVNAVYVTGILPTRNFYVNDFNTSSIDFIGNNFSVNTPSGFSDGAIHSDHPYLNGSGPNDESNYTYQLQIPIRINADNPYIRFDEIVLVEPGETGSTFGSSAFYDYVIVEGSKDSGITWKSLVDGYDARENSTWLSQYNNSISNDNSQSVGSPTLYKERLINMLSKGNFAAGDEILIRFRLFADQAAHGWGWAIDNLSIQGVVTGVESREEGLVVYPNPATTRLAVKFDSHQPQRLEVLDSQGTLVEKIELRGAAIDSVEIQLDRFQPGIYFLKVLYGSEHRVIKFIKRS